MDEFNGTAIITWFEHNQMHHEQAGNQLDFTAKLAKLLETIPKAHIAWYIINWDEHNIKAARGMLDG